MKKEHAITVGISMYPELFRTLRKIALKEERYLSGIVCEAIRDWLAKREGAKS